MKIVIEDEEKIAEEKREIELKEKEDNIEKREKEV